MDIANSHGAAPATVTPHQPAQPGRLASAVAHRPPRTGAPARPTEHSGAPEHTASPAPSFPLPDPEVTEPGARGDGAVLLAAHTADPITRLALVSYIRQFPDLALAPQHGPADIVVATLENPDDVAIATLRRQLPGEPRLLLIVEGVWTANLHAALDAGVRAVMFRKNFTWDRFGKALREVRAGHGDLPTDLQGRLMDQVQQTYREVLTPRGLTPGGLTQREADVLRLVAEGHELQEIGSELGYSERTIKNVLYGVIKRHRLGNRAHAVAYAIRCGLI